EVVAPKFERHFRRKYSLTLAPPEEVATRSTVLPAGKAFRPQGSPLGENGGGPILAKKSEGPPDPVPARKSAASPAVRDASVLLDAARSGPLEGFDLGVARGRQVGVYTGRARPVRSRGVPTWDPRVLGVGPTRRRPAGRVRA